MTNNSIDNADVNQDLTQIAVAFGQRDLGAVTQQTMSWDQLVGVLTEPTAAVIDHAEYMALPKDQRNALKKRDRFMLPGTCLDGKRDDAHLVYRSAATLDVDEDAATLYGALCLGCVDVPFAYVWHTTRSHTEEAPRLRVVVPFSRPVSAAEYRRIVPALGAAFGVTYDPASIKPSQMMFLPVRNAGAPFEKGGSFGSGFVDPDTLISSVDVVERASVPAPEILDACDDIELEILNNPNEEKRAEILSALLHLAPRETGYDKYQTRAQNLKHLGEVGYPLWLKYVESMPDYDPAADHRAKWDKDIKGDRSDYRAIFAAAYTAKPPWKKPSLAVLTGEVARVKYPHAPAKPGLPIPAQIGNVVVGLQHPVGGDVPTIRFDEFLGETVIADGASMRRLKDTDLTRIQEALERRGFAPLGVDMMRRAVDRVAEINTVDSAREWLLDLKWDGVGRVDSFAHTYLGMPLDAYTQAVSHYWWTAAAARAAEPGIKIDGVPVLVSEEGLRKTEAVMALAPTLETFSSLDLTAKQDDIARKMRGALVMEWAEMRGLKTRDEEAIKDFVTRRFEEWTPKYKEFAVRFPRRCLMIGTTNDFELLPSYGKGRRWFPLRITQQIDVAAIARDRDQLWAEGYHLFKHFGVLWEEAGLLAADVRDGFREEDSLKKPVVDWLDAPVDEFDGCGEKGTLTNGETEFCTADIVAWLSNRKLHFSERKLGPLLRDLGYEAGRVGRRKLRVWKRRVGTGTT